MASAGILANRVAGIVDEIGVITGSAGHRIGAETSIQYVVARAADQRIGAGAADRRHRIRADAHRPRVDRVPVVAAVDCNRVLRHAGEVVVREGERVRSAIGQSDRLEAMEARDALAARVAEIDLVVAVGAIDIA